MEEIVIKGGEQQFSSCSKTRKPLFSALWKRSGSCSMAKQRVNRRLIRKRHGISYMSYT